MKKLYTLLAAGLLVAGWAVANVSLPYSMTEVSEDPVEGVSDDLWTYYNPGNQEAWRKFQTRYRVWVTTEHTIDTWLTSPAFDVEEGYEYIVSFKMNLQSSESHYEHFDVHFTGVNPAENAEAAAAAPSIFSMSDLSGTTAGLTSTKEYGGSIVATATGKAYVTFHASGLAYRGINLYSLTVDKGEKKGETPVDPVDPVDPTDPDHECAGITLPYMPVLATADGLNSDWTIINNNNDNREWKATEDRSEATKVGLDPYVAIYPYSSSLQADDYLVSPAMHFEKGKEYKLMFWVRTKSDKENFAVYLSEGTTPDEIKAGKLLKEYVNYSNQSYQQAVIDYSPEKTGDYHLSVYAFSDKYKFNIYFAGFKALENKFAPSPVSSLTAVAAPERELKCTLSWALPTTDVFGTPLTAQQSIEKIEIFRDNAEQPVATLGGDATSWDDTEASGLTSGRHTYSVVVTVDGASAASKVGPTAYVGPVLPVDVPAAFPIATKDDYGIWSVLHGENSDLSPGDAWYYNETSGGSSARCQSGRYKTEDDWLITPPFNVTKPGCYRVTVDVELGMNAPHRLQGAVGKEATIEAMEIRNEAFELQRGRQKVSYDFYAAEAGTYYAALHAACPSRSDANNYYVFSVEVTESKAMPAAVEGLTAAAQGEENAVLLSWLNPEVSFAGMPMSADDYKIEIYLGDELAATVTEFVTGEEGNSYSLPVPAAGVYDITVKTVGNDGESAPSHPTVKTPWIGARVVDLPYTIDFTVENPTSQIWEFVDGNKDGKTWTYNSYSGWVLTPGNAIEGTGSGSSATYDYGDYILSPYLDLTPGYYIVKYDIRGGNNGYSAAKLYYNTGIIAAGTFDADNVELMQPKKEEIESTSFSTREYAFRITEAGRYQVVLAANEPNAYVSYSSYYLTVRGFTFAANPVVPEPATELAVTPAADGVLEATVSWLNPTETNIEGVTLGAGDIVKAVILRNGEVAGELTDGLLPGCTSQWLDTSLSQAGCHTYSVELYTAQGKSEKPAPSVKSTWIGGGLLVPYLAGPEQFYDWTIINVDNDSKEFYDEVLPLTWIQGKSGLNINVNTKDANDWAVSPLIELEADCLYKISTTGYHNTSYPIDNYTLEIRAYQGDDYTDYVQLHSFILSDAAIWSSKAETHSFYLLTPVAGDENVAPASEEGDEESRPEQTAARMPSGNTHLAIYSASKGDMVVNQFEITLEKRDVVGVDKVVADKLPAYADGTLLLDGDADVEIFNLSGALISKQAASGSLSLKHLDAGVYIVRVTSNSGSTTLKIVR